MHSWTKYARKHSLSGYQHDKHDNKSGVVTVDVWVVYVAASATILAVMLLGMALTISLWYIRRRSGSKPSFMRLDEEETSDDSSYDSNDERL